MFGDIYTIEEVRGDCYCHDIGEAKASVQDQEKYSRELRDSVRRRLGSWKPKQMCVKELAPWDPDVVAFCKEYRLGWCHGGSLLAG